MKSQSDSKKGKKKLIILLLLLIIFIILWFFLRQRIGWKVDYIDGIKYNHYDTVLNLDNSNKYSNLYKFEVSAKDEDEVAYRVYLTSEDELSKIKDDNIKISIKKNGEYIVEDEYLSNLSGFELDTSNGYYNLSSATIKGKDKDQFEVKIWVDTKKNNTNKKYQFDVKVYEVKKGDVKTVDINLDANGGKLSQSKINILETGKYGKLPTPTKEGYTFIGWYTEKTGGTPVGETDSYQSIKAKTLYARYEQAKYTVIINPNGGKYEGSTKVYALYGEEITLGKISKTGSTFNKWTSDAKISNNKVKITGDTTIKANWTANKYVLTINPNGGVYNGKENVQSMQVEYLAGKKISTPTREGYTFTGWIVDGSGTYSNGIYKSGLGTTTLTATWKIKSYRVRFDVNGGSNQVEERYIEYNKELGDLISPSKVGYTFEGWYDGETKVDKNSKITSDVTLKAEYTKNTYKLNIDPNGGKYDGNSDVVVEKIKYQENITIKEPTREDYLFAGWEISEGDYKLEDNKFTIGANDITIKAKWLKDDFAYIVKHYQENLDGKGYTLVDTDSYYNIKSKTEVTGALKNYAGFKAPEAKTITISTNNEKNIIEYKYQRLAYNLTIDPNGGEYAGSKDIEEKKNNKYESEIKIKKPSREGYTFTGWEQTGPGVMSSLVDEATLKIQAGDINLKALWKANKYQVTFDANGGVITSGKKEVTYDEKYGNLETPTKEGYTFNGWYTKKDGGEKITSEDIVKITKDVTLYAQWTINSYELTIDPNGGTYNTSGETQKFTLNYNQIMRVLKPVRVGYTFVSWNLEGKGSMTSLVDEATFTTGAGDTKLTADWQINVYAIKFDADGGTVNESMRDIEYNQAYGQMPIPSKTGYIFAGWYDGNELVTEQTKATKDTTLVAKWSAKDVSLTIKYGDGVKQDDVVNSKYDKTVTLTKPVREGYTFTGWNLVSGNSTVLSSTSQDSVVIMGSEDTVVEATWEANEYKVTYETNGGELQELVKYTKYDSKYTLETPTKEGYTFAGWYFENTYQNKLDENTVLKEAHDHTIYAKWEANTYTITYDYDGGEESNKNQEVIYNTSIGTLPVTKKEGYTFLGWYLEDKLITDNYIYAFSKNVTIKAKWSILSYELEIDPNGGTYEGTTASQKGIYEYNKQIDIKTPTRHGYIFTGWTITGPGILVNDKLTMKAGDTKLTAEWKKYAGKLTIKYEDGNTADKVIDNLGYEETYTVNEPVRDGYTFTGWTLTGADARLADTTFTMGTTDAVLTATWTANTYTYIVKHYKQNLDGKTYTLIEADTKEDQSLYGTDVTPEVKDYEGFTAPSKKTLTVTSNREKNVVEYKYTRNQNKLTIDPNGGLYNGQKDIEEKDVYYEDKIGLAIPTKEGHTFTGWTVKNAKLVDNLLTVGTKDIEVVANYKANQYMLIYNTNGGGIPVGGKVITYGELIGDLPTPTKAGYNFVGWYSDSEYKNEVKESDTFKFTEHTMIYAKWEKCDYKLTIDPNDGEYNNTANPTILGINLGDTTAIEKPVRYGYDFAGWTISGPGVLSSLIDAGTFTAGEGNTTITAIWTPKKFRLYYNANGGVVNPLSKELTFNEEYGVLDIPNKNGYVFDGWYTEKDNTTKVTENDILITEGDKHAYAHWTIDNFRLTVDPNGGVWTDENQEYRTPQEYRLDYQSTKEIKMPSRVGYTFTTWNYVGNQTDSKMSSMISDATFTMGYEDITLKALWEANKYTIVFDPQGGSVTDNHKTVTYDELYGSLPVATKEGYTFEGWYTDKTNGEKVLDTDTVKVTKTTTLYARYTQNEYIVTYDAVGGTLKELEKTVTYDNKYGELTEPTMTGYTFKGWYLDAAYNNKVDEKTVVKTASNHTLYAKWEINTYELIIDPNGGIYAESEDVSKQELKYKQTITLLTPTKEKYDFDGWEIIGNVTIVNNILTMEDGNTTIKAKWKKKKIYAAEVGYTPANPNWKVTNVKEALDYLLNN